MLLVMPDLRYHQDLENGTTVRSQSTISEEGRSRRLVPLLRKPTTDPWLITGLLANETFRTLARRSCHEFLKDLPKH